MGWAGLAIRVAQNIFPIATIITTIFPEEAIWTLAIRLAIPLADITMVEPVQGGTITEVVPAASATAVGIMAAEATAAAAELQDPGNPGNTRFPCRKEQYTVNLRIWRPWICLATSILWLLPGMAIAQNLTIDPPGERAFVQDLARMVQPDDVMAIRAIGEKLLTEQAIPIIVVTVDSMAQHGGAGWRIETFARVLFDQWGIGYETIEGQPWNRGVLLLVSKDDRKARIELGNDWAGAYDPICRKIMDDQIVPNFKKGKFSEGILAGVQELDKMCRSIPVPAEIVGGGNTTGSGVPAAAGGAQGPSSTHGSNLSMVNRDIKLSPPVRPDWFWPAVAVTVFLAVFTAISMIRSGSSGWAWALWAVVFGVIGFILYTAATSSGRHSRGGFGGGGGGGGFSGGSFGGGFGGGGGATGSW